jgi:MscS family membrane protein
MLFAIWISIKRLILPDELVSIIHKSYIILTVLNITWAVAKFAGILFDEYNKKTKINIRVVPLLKRAIFIIIWGVGILTALNNAGIEIAAIFAALGISGIAAALAAQDTIKNIFGGITIYTDSTFHIGDIIQFDGHEACVHDIGMRSTRLRTYDDRLITVPNYKLTDALVVNISSEQRRRVLIKLGVVYDTTPQKMKEAITILKSIPQNVREIDKETVAVFSDFGDSALVITYIYFILLPTDIREATSKVNFEILSRFNEAGLSFAYPSQTLYVENSCKNLNI